MALAAAATIAVAGGVAASLTRWKVTDAGLRARVLSSLEASSGLSAAASGPLTVRLLPQPTIEVRAIAMRGLDDAVVLDADAFRGRLDLRRLAAGELRLKTAAFDNPTIALDVDRLQPLILAMLRNGASGSLAPFNTAGLALHGGVVRLRSKDTARDMLLTDLSMVLTWPAVDAEASLTGSGTWRGVGGSFAVDVASPGAALRGGQTIASGRLTSAALDLDVQGLLSGSGDVQASGKLAASTPDLPAFLRTIAIPAPQLIGLHRARLDGTATVTGGDTLSLDPTTLDLDDMVFDGAMTVRRRDGRIGMAGTLATDSIELDPFLAALPPFMSNTSDWDTAPLATRSVAFDDIDLRISASTARFRSFVMEDGSLSLQSGDGRMELSIGEARAYDGLLKARFVATLDGAATEVRADATLSRLDLKGLFKDAPGGYRATGTLTSHLALGARGRTAAELVGDLSGRGQISVRNGAIGSKLLTALVRASPSAHLPAIAMLSGGNAPFDAASFDVAVDHGTASLGDSWIAWPDVRAIVDGSASLPGQTLNVRARIVPADSADQGAGDTVYDVKGSWRDLLLKPVRPRS